MPEAVKELENQELGTQGEAAGSTDSSGGKGSGGLKKLLLMFIGAQLVMAVGAFSFVKFYLAPKIQYAYEHPFEEPAVREKGEIHLIENLLVNPAGTNGTRFLSTSIGIETSKLEGGGEGEGEAMAAAGFAAISPIVRDILNAVLSSKTMEELSSVEGKSRLREEILTKLNEAVAPDSVYNVYFVDYVLQ